MIIGGLHTKFETFDPRINEWELEGDMSNVISDRSYSHFAAVRFQKFIYTFGGMAGDELDCGNGNHNGMAS